MEISEQLATYIQIFGTSTSAFQKAGTGQITSSEVVVGYIDASRSGNIVTVQYRMKESMANYLSLDYYFTLPEGMIPSTDRPSVPMIGDGSIYSISISDKGAITGLPSSMNPGASYILTFLLD